jgi:ATP-dependent 26S proteasome regulatory subunit
MIELGPYAKGIVGGSLLKAMVMGNVVKDGTLVGVQSANGYVLLRVSMEETQIDQEEKAVWKITDNTDVCLTLQLQQYHKGIQPQPKENKNETKVETEKERERGRIPQLKNVQRIDTHDWHRKVCGEVGGLEDVVRKMCEAISVALRLDAYAHSQEGQWISARDSSLLVAPHCLLLHGMHGTGKTLLARSFVKHSGLPYYWINGSEVFKQGAFLVGLDMRLILTLANGHLR